MPRIVDDDPPIKTGAASKEYRDNWDRIFGGKPCDGFYDDGVMSTRCQNREGCGRKGCPAEDFGVTRS